MTAFAFDLSADHLAIAADTAAYMVGSEARLIGFTSRVFTIPRLRLALCGRGLPRRRAEWAARKGNRHAA
jgi:hypothetical protein